VSLLSTPHAALFLCCLNSFFGLGMISLAYLELTKLRSGFGRYVHHPVANMTTYPWEMLAKLDLLSINTPSSSDAAFIVHKLNLLLLNGRLSARNKKIIVSLYQSLLARTDKNEIRAVRYALQMFFSCTEFHTTNVQKNIAPSLLATPGNAPAPALNDLESGENRGRKSIVFVLLSGNEIYPYLKIFLKLILLENPHCCLLCPFNLQRWC